MARQPITVTDLSFPDHMLTFDEIVYKGYDTEAERNKKETISIYKYPLCLYVAYKQILRHTDNPLLHYISDIQRYSTLLGHAILEHATWYLEIEEKYNDACDSENQYIQEALDSTKSYTFQTPTRSNRRGIKTLAFIQESLEVKSNILGIHGTDLIILCSLLGLTSASLTKSNKQRILLECESFKKYVEFTKTGFYDFKERLF